MARLPFSKKTTLPDLSALSLDELTELHNHVGKHLVDRKETRIKELQAELDQLTASNDGSHGVGNSRRKAKGGIDPVGIKTDAPRVGNGKTALNGNRVGNGKPARDIGKSRAKSKVTHRGPNGETWTSRGAKPRWLVALIAEGKNVDDFKVSG